MRDAMLERASSTHVSTAPEARGTIHAQPRHSVDFHSNPSPEKRKRYNVYQQTGDCVSHVISEELGTHGNRGTPPRNEPLVAFAACG
jgi:hypothetical protein